MHFCLRSIILYLQHIGMKAPSLSRADKHSRMYPALTQPSTDNISTFSEEPYKHRIAQTQALVLRRRLPANVWHS